MIRKFDEHLKFDLPAGWTTEKGTDDNGNDYFGIRNGKEKNESTYAATVRLLEGGELSTDSDRKLISLGGKRKNSFKCISSTISILNVEMLVLNAMLGIAHESGIYTFLFRLAYRQTEDSRIKGWIDFINATIASVRIDGVDCSFDKLTRKKLDSATQSQEEREAENAPFPYAVPDENLHSQLNFQVRTRSALGMLGGAVHINTNGTEFSFNALSDYVDNGMVDDAKTVNLYKKIVEKNNDSWKIAETALDMARVFRVAPEYFNPSHDYEQEIEAGLIKKINSYTLFRSFVWTLCAYCDQENIEPSEVNIDTLEQIASYVAGRNNLNFKADSYATSICSTDDIGTYYIPDAVTPAMRNQLRSKSGSKSDSPDPVASLDQLRNDLAYVAPAMQEIHQVLESEKTGEPFEDKLAEVLYVWCCMAYAARTPFYTEDGPMNCMFEYPGTAEKTIRKTVKASFQQAAKDQEEQWISRHYTLVTKNPKITFRNKTFVFNISKNHPEAETIRKALTDKGALVRDSVSEKTDYLVCDPSFKGEAKITKAHELYNHGSGIQVIVLSALTEALGLSGDKEETEINGSSVKPAASIPDSRIKPEEYGITYREGNRERLPDGNPGWLYCFEKCRGARLCCLSAK